MNKDITLPCEDGIVNIRVGAIIQKDGKILMVGNKIRPKYLYSVGGRIKFGETAEDAVKREVFEETGITSYTKQSFWFNKDFVEKIINGKE